MALLMPSADPAILARRGEIVAALRAIVLGEGVIDDPVALRPSASDALTAYRQPPMVVVLSETTEQVSHILAWCHANGVKVVPRGAGTSLSGGALPLEDGVLLSLARMNRVLEIDYHDRIAVVQPGVTNLAVTRAVEDCKADALVRLGANVIATGNIGCAVQIGRRGALPVMHVLELLGWAIGGPVPPRLRHLATYDAR